jgi:hypothetical protein
LNRLRVSGNFVLAVSLIVSGLAVTLSSWPSSPFGEAVSALPPAASGCCV